MLPTVGIEGFGVSPEPPDVSPLQLDDVEDAPIVGPKVHYQYIVDSLTRSVLGITYGVEPHQANGHVERGMFERVIWPTLGQLERHNFNQGKVAQHWR